MRTWKTTLVFIFCLSGFLGFTEGQQEFQAGKGGKFGLGLCYLSPVPDSGDRRNLGAEQAQ